MKKSKINLFIIIGLIVIILGFIGSTYNDFRIQENFTGIPLNFNPTNSVSSYDWNGINVTIKGGFVKGKVTQSKTENLILRSLSSTPQIRIKGNPKTSGTYLIRLENVNPADTTFSNLDRAAIKILEPHTLLLTINLKASEDKTINVSLKDNKQGFEFVMLGDNRDGYDTFSNIIDQVNAINPIFTVDDGDLVYGGEPHKYRLFNETVSKFKVPLYTTLGNHDIRENGRPTYTKIFGPPYYSFEYKNAHFVFLDSSRGWSEKTSIPQEQYVWLENDLKNAKGKMIFVFSHIPPIDPRADKKTNIIPYASEEEKPSLIDRLANNYSEYKSLNHGFPDSNEALKFENLMTKYKVNTVFTSHIHSYISYVKNDVRYVISGGAGAELLTTNSYYHYLVVKVADKDTFIEAIELPSPTNTIQDRYIAAIRLFAKAIYKEYTTIVIGIITIAIILLLWIMWNARNKWKKHIKLWTKLLVDIFSFSIKKYKELKEKYINK
ncbi:metallophosphoesterase [Clostridium estertheticum]|uniref:metallophosphoesterase family protein n=1 Tax=Clostridium estertheticum TaxID=238834 RepID=UPI0013E91571|nr:metallophosphoesterase [Clostridium estertheticum]MBZ9686628.1 metallophosphoesterase [Clostridium estertheticum]